MARQRAFKPTPLVRGLVRSEVRGGRSFTEVVNAVVERFNNVDRRSLNAMVRQEQQRQMRVDTVMNADKRKTLDLRQLAGCQRKSDSVMASITISWYDDTRGVRREFTQVAVLGNSGRLSDNINRAIAAVAQDAVGRGYVPPKITSAMTTGSNYYSINYIECTR